MSGNPLPYFSSIPAAIDENEAPQWLIQRCADLGLEYLYITTTQLRDIAHASDVRNFGTGRGVRIVGGASANG